jgi:hypothetical protein
LETIGPPPGMEAQSAQTAKTSTIEGCGCCTSKTTMSRSARRAAGFTGGTPDALQHSGHSDHAASGASLESPLKRCSPKRSDNIEEILLEILRIKDKDQRHGALHSFMVQEFEAFQAFEEFCKNADDVPEEFEAVDDDQIIDYERVEDELSDTNVLENMNDDLLPIDDHDEGAEVAIAIDSGAVDHVANDEDMPGIEVVPSASSIAGRHFMGANGKTIENRGQAAVAMKSTSTGANINSVFQIARVSRPLYSVSRICDAGCDVQFTKTEGRVSKGGKLIATFPRKGGLYVSTFTVKPADPRRHKDMGFQRPA